MWSKQLLLLCNFSHLLARTSRRLCLVLTVFCESLSQSTQSCSRCLRGHGLFMGCSGRGGWHSPNVAHMPASVTGLAAWGQQQQRQKKKKKTVPEVYNSKYFLMSNNEVKQFIRLLWCFYTCKHHCLFYWVKHGHPLWALKLTHHAKSQMDWVQLLQPLRGNKTTMSNDLSVNQPPLPLTAWLPLSNRKAVVSTFNYCYVWPWQHKYNVFVAHFHTLYLNQLSDWAVASLKLSPIKQPSWS